MSPKGVPLAGIAFGAGMNYRTIRRSVITATYLYRERFLLTKYDAWAEAPEISIDDIQVVRDRDLEPDDEVFGDSWPLPDVSIGDEPGDGRPYTAR